MFSSFQNEGFAFCTSWAKYAFTAVSKVLAMSDYSRDIDLPGTMYQLLVLVEGHQSIHSGHRSEPR